ncbi:MAG TPA: hypothetical protein VNJ01_09450 [Bacteriovoracaceae bacterium]|nr:hypothetical protein [Bacteriovoracaceae bacterium]
MNFEETYQQIISEIALGRRALKKFTAQELEEITNSLRTAHMSRDFEYLEKALCLVLHSASLSEQFERPILEVLALDGPDQVLIFALNCSRKHVIQARFQRGKRLEYDFLETLRRLLHSKSPEVVEWTLRTIEECGNQGVYFLQDFDKIKPHPLKWFNAHQRAVSELITLLKRRWSPFEKSKS